MAMSPESIDERAAPLKNELSDPLDPETLVPATTVFHALSEPARLMILQHLRLGEHRVRDLTDHLGLAQSTVSAHLACLRDCGLVTSRPHGRASLFSLTAEPELLAVLTAAEQLLAVAGAPSGEHAAHDERPVAGRAMRGGER